MADIKINGVTPSGFYYGATAASAVYYGATKLWEAVPPTPYNVIGGKTYPTVTMPDGREWLAVNLDYAWTGLSVPTSNVGVSSSPQAMYYQFDETTYGWNGYKYGLTYNWIAVKYLEDNKASLCPGWHVPSINEWSQLFTSIGGSTGAGTKLKSTTLWANGAAGTDDYGFAVLPASGYSGSWSIANYTYLWTASEYDTSKAQQVYFNSSANAYSQRLDKTYQYSVRLIRDY